MKYASILEKEDVFYSHFANCAAELRNNFFVSLKKIISKLRKSRLIT